MDTEQNLTPSQRLNWIILDTVTIMRDKDIAQDNKAYYKAFEYGYQMVAARLPIEQRLPLERDYWKMKDQERIIKDTKDKAEITKQKEIEQLNKDFADRHRFYIFRGLSQIGVDTLQSEATMDFNKYDINRMAKIIRDTGGLASAVK